ncbi:hypothetical protein B0H12DRAFT_1243875 [Mycena haematopus]|nr:hypothetical protein B0H12DRAFT_1245847 [Mycena haematopus]KAJ7202989.1 hypothetical protein B0H12DRAFT_1243875 [Mycena haematopus]
MSRNDPVIDRANPNPVVNRKESTRQNSKPPPGAGSSKSAGNQQSAPSRQPYTVPRAPNTGPRPSSSTPRVDSPTAASAARSVHAPAPLPPPFGSSERRMPSHMHESGKRGPKSPNSLPPPPSNEDEGQPVSAVFVSAAAGSIPSQTPQASAVLETANDGVEGSPPHVIQFTRVSSTMSSLSTSQSEGSEQGAVSARS